MAKQQSNSQRSIRSRARQHRQRQRLIPIIAIVVVGVLLIATAWFLLGDRGSVETAFARKLFHRPGRPARIRATGSCCASAA